MRLSKSGKDTRSGFIGHGGRRRCCCLFESFDVRLRRFLRRIRSLNIKEIINEQQENAGREYFFRWHRILIFIRTSTSEHMSTRIMLFFRCHRCFIASSDGDMIAIDWC